MEIKGFIKKGEHKNLTCCESIIDIELGGVSLYDELEKVFKQDEYEYFEDSEKKSPEYGVKYVILDEAPLEDISFNDLCAQVQQNMMYVEHYAGCYSEYTCGYGGFDYVLEKDGKGHSVFSELESYIGKWCHFTI